MRSSKPRSVGISIENSSNVRVSGGNLSGVGIGIQIKDSSGTLIDRTQFKDVGLPILAEGSGGVSISSSTATGAKISQNFKDAPALPSYCPKCHHTFPSRFARFKGPVVQFWGNKESCPNCGFEDAFVAEGVFQFIAELIQILWATPETKRWLSTPTSARNAAGGTNSKPNPVGSSVLPQEALSWIRGFVNQRRFEISLGTLVAIATLAWTVLNDREASKQFERLLELERQQIETDAKWEREIATDALIIQVLREWGSLSSNARQQSESDENPDQRDQ